MKTPSSAKLEEEGNPLGFPPPPPSFCNGHLSLLSFSLFDKTPSYLEVSLDLSLDLSRILKMQQKLWIAFLRLSPILERLLHHQNGRICVGLKTGFFQVQYAPFHQPKLDTRLSSITTDTLVSWRTLQWCLSTSMRWSVVHMLLRMDLTRWLVGPMCWPESTDVPLHCSCCVLSFFLLCYVTLCNFLWLYCFVVSPFCLVFICIGVDFLFLYFWFPFGSFFFHSYFTTKSPWLFRMPI